MNRVLNSLLWGSVMGLLLVAASGSLYLGYWGLLALMGGDVVGAAGPLAVSVLLATAACLLGRHSDDLIDR